MRPNQESTTSIFVCMGRAYAHGQSSVGRFSDPTALALLPEEARARVERARAHARPRTLVEGIGRPLLRQRSKIMVARTVAIDDAIREKVAPQLVILGAGLDGRAWRMPELSDVTVFEVDHPATQRAKRERSATLPPAARDIRFVPVDFTKDSLDDALEKAGHDRSRPTTWVWEGVVMYLALADIKATLDVLRRRSASGTRLVVVYHRPAPILILGRALVRRVGEPLRSQFLPDEMRALLGEYGLRVVRDENLADIAARLPRDVARAARIIKHLRIATADVG